MAVPLVCGPFAAALKGAGDTFYIMCMLLVIPLLGLVVPTYVAVTFFDAGLYTVWVIISLYIAMLAMSFYARFRVGKWKHMRVIEQSDVIESVEG